MAGWYTPATTGAEAAPPMFAMLPVAMKNKGARNQRRQVEQQDVESDPDDAGGQVEWCVEHRAQIGLGSDSRQEQIQPGEADRRSADLLEVAHACERQGQADCHYDQDGPGRAADDRGVAEDW